MALQKPWKDGCRHPPSGPAASGKPGAALASPGSAGVNVLLCGAGSSAGLGNCLTYTDKKWQIISSFFRFTKVSLETPHQFRMFRVFVSDKPKYWKDEPISLATVKKQMYWEVI